MRAYRLYLAGVLIAALMALMGLTACGDGWDNVGDDTEQVAATEYEDCDVEDQSKKEDDCGYWQKDGAVYVGAQPDNTWFWVWFTWVHLGQTSLPPSGWTPPRGVPKPPTRTVYRTAPKNNTGTRTNTGNTGTTRTRTNTGSTGTTRSYTGTTSTNTGGSYRGR